MKTLSKWQKNTVWRIRPVLMWTGRTQRLIVCWNDIRKPSGVMRPWSRQATVRFLLIIIWEFLITGTIGFMGLTIIWKKLWKKLLLHRPISIRWFTLPGQLPVLPGKMKEWRPWKKQWNICCLRIAWKEWCMEHWQNAMNWTGIARGRYVRWRNGTNVCRTGFCFIA